MKRKKLYFIILLSFTLITSCSTDQTESTDLKKDFIPKENTASNTYNSKDNSLSENKHQIEYKNLYIKLNGRDYNLNSNIYRSDLIGMNKTELEILRNAIFAKHGYIFKNNYYYNYFTQFDWYIPKYENVEEFLTNEDKSNIDLILSIENNLKMNPLTIDSESFENEIIGMWHVSPGVASGYFQYFLFHKDGTLIFDYGDNSMRNINKTGYWSIKNGKMVLTFDKTKVITGGTVEEDIITGQKLVGGQVETKNLEVPEIIILDTKIYFDNKNFLKRIEIGDFNYWKFSDDPNNLTTPEYYIP